MLKTYFDNPHSEVWLNYVHSQAAYFPQLAKKTGSESTLAVEVLAVVCNLQ